MKRLVFSLLAVGLVGTLLAGEKKVAGAKDAATKCPTECKLTASKEKECTDKVKASAFTKVNFKISNVGCEESCDKLAKTVAGLKGVKGQTVCAQSKTASIEYKSGETCSKTLHAALIKAGYQVEGQQASLKVNEVHCEAGAAELKATLAKLKGVQSGDVCHNSGTANILFDPEKTSSKEITAQLAKNGYTLGK